MSLPQQSYLDKLVKSNLGELGGGAAVSPIAVFAFISFNKDKGILQEPNTLVVM